MNFKGETLKRISFNFRDTDFLHTEQHAEMEGEHDEHEEEEGHDEHGHGGPTSFTNDATEFSTIFDFGNDVVSRKAMIIFIETDRAVVGSEAHMNPVSSEMFMLGYYTGTTFDVYDVNFGFRFDKVNRKAQSPIMRKNIMMMIMMKMDMMKRSMMKRLISMTLISMNIVIHSA